MEDQLVLETKLAISDFRSLKEELAMIAGACREALETRGSNAELFAKFSVAAEANDLLIAQNSQLRRDFDELAESLAKDKLTLEQSIISDRNYQLDKEHILDLVTELAAAKSKVNELKLEISSLGVSRVAEVSAISDLRRSISDFRTTELEKNKSVAAVEKRAVLAEREAFAAKSEISSTRKSLEISEREATELRELLHKQNTVIKNLEISNQNFQQQISALKVDNESLNNQLDVASASLAMKSAEVEEFKFALLAEDRAKAVAIEKISAQVKEVETAVTHRLEGRIREISAHNDDLIRETAEAKARAEALARELETSQRRSEILISGLKKENQRLVFEVESVTFGKSSLRNFFFCVLHTFALILLR